MTKKRTKPDESGEYVDAFQIWCDCGGTEFELFFTAGHQVEARCMQCDCFIDVTPELDS